MKKLVQKMTLIATMLFLRNISYAQVTYNGYFAYCGQSVNLQTQLIDRNNNLTYAKYLFEIATDANFTQSYYSAETAKGPKAPLLYQAFPDIKYNQTYYIKVSIKVNENDPDWIPSTMAPCTFTTEYNNGYFAYCGQNTNLQTQLIDAYSNTTYAKYLFEIATDEKFTQNYYSAETAKGPRAPLLYQAFPDIKYNQTYYIKVSIKQNENDPDWIPSTKAPCTFKTEYNNGYFAYCGQSVNLQTQLKDAYSNGTYAKYLFEIATDADFTQNYSSAEALQGPKSPLLYQAFPNIKYNQTYYIKVSIKQNENDPDWIPSTKTPCTFTTIPCPSTLTITTSTTPTCAGTGTATITATGGTAPYTYTFNDANNAKNETGIVENLTAGTYTVTVEDKYGCSNSTTFTISAFPALVLTSTTTDVSCNGDNNGAVSLTVTGGTAPFTYAWSNGATTKDITNLSAGTYTVTVTDANGCTKTANTIITEPDAITLRTTKTDVKCNNGTDGTATVFAAGGNLPYTYSWNTSPVQTTVIAGNLSAGTYTVTMTDANGCPQTANVTIAEPLKPLNLKVTKYDIGCFDDNAGVIFAEPSGGTPPYYTFIWGNTFHPIGTFPGAPDITGITPNNPDMSYAFVLAPSYDYFAYISDYNDCNTYEWITIEKFNSNITITGTPTFCNGSTIDLQANPFINGATYTWNTTPEQTTQNITVDKTGYYSVTMDLGNTHPECPNRTFTNGININTVKCPTTGTDLTVGIVGTQEILTTTCQSSLSTCYECIRKIFNVTISNYGPDPAPICSLVVTLPSQVKYLSSAIYNSDMTGTTPYEPNLISPIPNTLEWDHLCDIPLSSMESRTLRIETEIPYFGNTACDPVIPPATFDASATITPEDGGLVNFTSEQQPFFGSLDPNDKMLIQPVGKGICNTVLSSDTLIYQINFQNTGKAPAFSVLLFDTIDVTKFDISSVKTLQTSHSAEFNIVNNNILVWSFWRINLPDSASDLTGSSGFVKYSIKLKPDIAPSTVINNEASIVFDYNEPVITNTVSNTILGLPVTIAASGATTFCQGDSVVLTASAANSYLWNTGDTTQSITVKASGKYSVIDVSSCLANSDSITVTVNPLPVANAGVDQTLYLGYGPQSIDLVASASGGTTPYTYSWNTGALTAGTTVAPVVSTTYEVTVTDANGCSASDAVMVNVIDVRYCKEEKGKEKGKGEDKGKGRKEKEECKIIICHHDKKEGKNKEGDKGKKEGKRSENDDHFDGMEYQTLIVDRSAVAAHLAHGDYLGSCVTVAAKKGEEEIAASAISTAKTNAMRLENFPNPFSTTTTIQFSVPQTTPVKLEIYGITGNLLETLFEGTVEENKSYSITYDAKELPSGVYFYKLSSANEISNKKMLIVR